MRIIVDDENDHAPEFTLSAYEGRVMENSPAGTEITLSNPIVASDKDEGENRNFAFALRGEGSGLFRIDPITGHMYFVGVDDGTLDRESRANYELQVIATDSGTYMYISELQLPPAQISRFISACGSPIVLRRYPRLLVHGLRLCRRWPGLREHVEDNGARRE